MKQIPGQQPKEQQLYQNTPRSINNSALAGKLTPMDSTILSSTLSTVTKNKTLQNLYDSHLYTTSVFDDDPQVSNEVLLQELMKEIEEIESRSKLNQKVPHLSSDNIAIKDSKFFETQFSQKPLQAIKQPEGQQEKRSCPGPPTKPPKGQIPTLKPPVEVDNINFVSSIPGQTPGSQRVDIKIGSPVRPSGPQQKPIKQENIWLKQIESEDPPLLYWNERDPGQFGSQ